MPLKQYINDKYNIPEGKDLGLKLKQIENNGLIIILKFLKEVTKTYK